MEHRPNHSYDEVNMSKPISTKTHGVIDYMMAVTLFALPRVFGWGKQATMILTGSAIAHLGYSLLTRYELGAGVLPMKGHLALDAMTALGWIAAGALIDDEMPAKATLMGLGVQELGIVMMERDRAGRRDHRPDGEATQARDA
jgi:hypothetical protein